MARLFHLRIDVDDARRPLAGAVLLRIRGTVVLDWRLVGLSGSALALARAAEDDHRAAADDASARSAEWPLFFGAESLANQCGEVADFSVTHAGATITLSDFYGCAVPRAARFDVPWSAFANAVIQMGDVVIRRTRGDWREELRTRLRPVRRRRRTLVRAESPRP